MEILYKIPQSQIIWIISGHCDKIKLKQAEGRAVQQCQFKSAADAVELRGDRWKLTIYLQEILLPSGIKRHTIRHVNVCLRIKLFLLDY